MATSTRWRRRSYVVGTVVKKVSISHVAAKTVTSVVEPISDSVTFGLSGDVAIISITFTS